MAEAERRCEYNEADSVPEPSLENRCQPNANQHKFPEVRPNRHQAPLSTSAPMQYPNAIRCNLARSHRQSNENGQLSHHPGNSSEEELSTITEMSATSPSSGHQSSQPLRGKTDSLGSIIVQKSDSSKFRPGTKNIKSSLKENTGHNIIINRCQNLQIGNNNTMTVSNCKHTFSDSSKSEESDTSSDSESSD